MNIDSKKLQNDAFGTKERKTCWHNLNKFQYIYGGKKFSLVHFSLVFCYERFVDEYLCVYYCTVFMYTALIVHKSIYAKIHHKENDALCSLCISSNQFVFEGIFIFVRLCVYFMSSICLSIVL
jgi:hypothetical protein